MLPEMTLAVARALAAAEHLARGQGLSEAEARHVLAALLLEEEGRPAGLIREQGLEPGHVTRLAGLSLADIGAVPSDLPPPTGRGAAATLAFAARRVARELCGESVVATEHLFLAVLREDASLRTRLETAGLSLSRIEAQLRPEPLRLEEPLALLEPTEQVDSARILDANANRAREALRTLEDYCRFVLDDAFLSGELKSLRHDLAEALSVLPVRILLAARDTLHDVGTTLTVPSEERRTSLTAVVQAACKRLQESLRSLEEYGKLHDPNLGRSLEALRYRAYILEKALLACREARERLADVRLYVLVSVATCAGSMEWTVREALAGGAQVIQLREKNLPDREWLARARQIRDWTRQAGALFIVNDRPDLARLCEADGVHVGQEDLPIKEVRRIVGPEMLVGVSTHNPEQLRQAILDGADYVGVGPTFPSKTKNFDAFAGLDYVRCAASSTSIPAFAIGGITLDNVDQVLACGVRRIAVGHAVCASEDPQRVAAELRRRLDAAS
ncbi:MAG: thiamine phosphate synthase [Gemmatales bacterium]|nr:thiamine phosphate synthase [Gemmatales bacterium]MDW8385468.1 thiamine phosphate synthase [Gemmatales bacterium]